jgi:hypothetical protein
MQQVHTSVATHTSPLPTLDECVCVHPFLGSAGALDTSQPTPHDKTFSYVIEYSVSDFSGNAAPTARRLIRVVCPGKETYCLDPDTAQPTCTTDGVCGKPAALSMSGSSMMSSNPKAPPAAAAAAVPPGPPSISLRLPGSMQVDAGSLYDRCAADAPLGSLCELGATAEDAKDGVLDGQVMVCGNR